ncbi:MAG TPA: branched-chain amino acid ABC transporter substrate-binding protein [Gaiellaceae bacterium]|nr:branched-chain amino acid ABC transporter substrate-binding protein [Gaiellaceae bacterium]
MLPSSSCGPVFYKGSGSPQYLIATDLPLQGAGRAQNLAMGQAVRFVLEKQFKFKAGKYSIGFQECDDSTAQTGAWDPAKCSSNARAYAADRTLIGVLGTFNSGCSKLIVPILNRAPGGAVAMLSSANTNVGLTHFAPWNSPGEPKIYYPTGVRNYARVAASDDYQGPAAADYLKLKKFKNVFIVHDNQTFGKGVAQAFQARAKKLGLKIAGFVPWDAKATSYEAIGEQIASSGADSVYLGGIVCNNGVKLIKDLRAAVGPKPQFVAPDGFTPYSATLEAGSAAQGMVISYAGQPLQKLGPAGKKFIAQFRAYAKIKGNMPPYAVYQAQSAQIMLAAIAKSNGTRASVVREMFKTRVTNGIMGTFRFDKNGDIIPNKWISFDKLKGNAGLYEFAVVTKVGK